jgi:hypothetical protein
MAGHNKWAKVKHFKGAIDAKRGKILQNSSAKSPSPPNSVAAIRYEPAPAHDSAQMPRGQHARRQH